MPNNSKKIYTEHWQDITARTGVFMYTKEQVRSSVAPKNSQIYNNNGEERGKWIKT